MSGIVISEVTLFCLVGLALTGVILGVINSIEQIQNTSKTDTEINNVVSTGNKGFHLAFTDIQDLCRQISGCSYNGTP